jgi:hypothetical protein
VVTLYSRPTVAFRSILQSGVQVALREAIPDTQLDCHEFTIVGKDSRVESFVHHIIVAALPVAAADHKRSIKCLGVGWHVGSGHGATGSVLVRTAVTVADWYRRLVDCGLAIRVGGRDWDDGSAGGHRAVVGRTGTLILCRTSCRIGCGDPRD